MKTIYTVCQNPSALPPGPRGGMQLANRGSPRTRYAQWSEFGNKRLRRSTWEGVPRFPFSCAPSCAVHPHSGRLSFSPSLQPACIPASLSHSREREFFSSFSYRSASSRRPLSGTAGDESSASFASTCLRSLEPNLPTGVPFESNSRTRSKGEWGVTYGDNGV